MLVRLAARLGPALAITLFLLFAAAGYLISYYSGTSWKFFAENATNLSGLQSAATIVIILAGAVIAYFRFFAHRVFVQRADLKMKIACYPRGARGSWHVIEVWIENHGNLAIRIENLSWACDHYSDAGFVSEAEGSSLFMPNFADDMKSWVVDSGETEHVMMEPLAVGAAVKMSLYSATLIDRSGRAWTCYCSTPGTP